jgi:hypothetical protein
MKHFLGAALVAAVATFTCVPTPAQAKAHD